MYMHKTYLLLYDIDIICIQHLILLKYAYELLFLQLS